MILLSGHSLNAEKILPVTAQSLTLNERQSVTEITLDDTSGIGIDSWMRDDKDPGRGIVWRVASMGMNFFTNTPTVKLEHIVNTLKDTIVFGSVEVKDITGNENDLECTAIQALNYVLSRQSLWALGDVDNNPSNAYKFNGDTVFSCLETISGTMGDVLWEYDLSRLPFRISFRNKSAAVGSEMRANRNLATISRTIDRTSMYTRFFPIGKDDLHITGDCVSRNVDAYGAIDHVETDTEIETEAELIAWANEKLNVHAEPAVTIEITGLDLSASTGESLDSFTVGRICRVPLPEFGGAIIKERISQIVYQDKISTPEIVKITLSNAAADTTHSRGLAEVLAEEQKSSSSSGRGGRGAAKKEKEDHAWFEDTNEHVAMCAIGIIGTDAQGNPNWTRLSEVIVDGEGIHQHVTEMQGELVIAETKIENNGREIRQEATLRENGDVALQSSITQTASEIRSEVTNKVNGVYSTISQTATQIQSSVNNQIAGVNSRITQTANEINATVSKKVGKNEVISCINQTAEQITISASKINLSGYVTADQLNAANAKINNLTSGVSEATLVKSRTFVATASLQIYNGATFHFHGYSIDYTKIEYKDHSGNNQTVYALCR